MATNNLEDKKFGWHRCTRYKSSNVNLINWLHIINIINPIGRFFQRRRALPSSATLVRKQ